MFRFGVGGLQALLNKTSSYQGKHSEMQLQNANKPHIHISKKPEPERKITKI